MFMERALAGFIYLSTLNDTFIIGGPIHAHLPALLHISCILLTILQIMIFFFLIKVKSLSIIGNIEIFSSLTTILQNAQNRLS
jgi:uncharacterized membrane protein YhdT